MVANISRKEAKDILISSLERMQNSVEYILDDIEVYTHENIRSVATAINNGLPIQYATQCAYFYGRRFFVDERVLIPRPETEELVREMIRSAKSMNKDVRILDVGTGSGIIPITIKHELPQASVIAVDYSTEALEVAQSNAQNHGTEIDFFHVDFLDSTKYEMIGQVDIVISNPPYIPRKEMPLMGDDVIAHEPHMALFVDDDDALIFYEALAIFGESHILPGGFLYCEINEYLAQETAQLFVEKGYHDVELIRDMQGKYRICKGRV